MKTTKDTNKATRINIFSFAAPHMRTFHLSWISFFLCFFGWFGVAPLMAVIREELSLTQSQIGNTIIASVAITVIARIFIGRFCDKYGPRLTYTVLLIFGSIPVIGIGLSNSYETFLLFRLAIGIIGASFVITQYHTSIMFADNVVGTANATTAGWGNMGGGATQMIMPMIFAGFIFLGFEDASAWRWAMVVPGVAMIILGILYYNYTTDTPKGNFSELEIDSVAEMEDDEGDADVSMLEVMKDYRVWSLFVIYGGSFGIELTINNIAAIYYYDYFSLDLETAGLIAGLFGLMNLFARSFGGYLGDKFGIKAGLKGRVRFLFVMLFLEGLALMLFSSMTALTLAIGTMIFFSLCVQMAEGATYSVVPFVNRKAVGAVSGIVGAGGNAGAVMAGFLFKYESLSYPEALFIIGGIVTVVSFLAFTIQFSQADEKEARMELKEAMGEPEAELEPAYVE
ncbi:NarK family nitrate/nitrite MFS transporter [Aliifodinibius sp. S!AR15-10]|uniref:NarK family nitrate/nitrite MFS transporter n=1 Tax=Aliifodinibius sp. S!AR15-10 TaxID=2950437 RepID=UPI00285911EC|nr:NarK family nitrate/nitrite MFS transporter [Aliifodinibius sp. S!AR15-10]MDR8394144.1 NarK family nitrate/nitrite MFS transporter [Aliifodinibius sp. S!AR15-10]